MEYWSHGVMTPGRVAALVISVAVLGGLNYGYCYSAPVGEGSLRERDALPIGRSLSPHPKGEGEEQGESAPNRQFRIPKASMVRLQAFKADPPEVSLGERLFLETRFAQWFFARSKGDAN